jgi:hypothetical protein
VVEHYLDTVGVTGSNPVSRTILPTYCQSGRGFGSKSHWFDLGNGLLHVPNDGAFVTKDRDNRTIPLIEAARIDALQAAPDDYRNNCVLEITLTRFRN